MTLIPCASTAACNLSASLNKSSTLSSNHITYSTARNKTPLFPFPLVLPLAPFGLAPAPPRPLPFELAFPDEREVAAGWGASMVVNWLYPSRMVLRRLCSERICLTRFSGVVRTGFVGRLPDDKFPPLLLAFISIEEPPMRIGCCPSSERFMC